MLPAHRALKDGGVQAAALSVGSIVAHGGGDLRGGGAGAKDAFVQIDGRVVVGEMQLITDGGGVCGEDEAVEDKVTDGSGPVEDDGDARAEEGVEVAQQTVEQRERGVRHGQVQARRGDGGVVRREGDGEHGRGEVGDAGGQEDGAWQGEVQRGRQVQRDGEHEGVRGLQSERRGVDGLQGLPLVGLQGGVGWLLLHRARWVGLGWALRRHRPDAGGSKPRRGRAEGGGVKHGLGGGGVSTFDSRLGEGRDCAVRAVNVGDFVGAEWGGKRGDGPSGSVAKKDGTFCKARLSAPEPKRR